MSKIKIAIVEDEVIIADDIQALLQDIGYECIEPCGSYGEAIAMLTEQQPDIVILDVNLGGKKDGIDIARFIRNTMDIPFIFLTANSDPATVSRARETFPNAYLVKPFQKADLYTAIEVALFNFNNSPKSVQVQPPEIEKTNAHDALFIKDGYYFHKVRMNEIRYLSSENVYVTVHTDKKNYLVRTTLQEYLEKFDPTKFIRVHLRYAVNMDHIEKITSASLVINNEEIPISKSYYPSVLARLNVG